MYNLLSSFYLEVQQTTYDSLMETKESRSSTNESEETVHKQWVTSLQIHFILVILLFSLFDLSS